MIDSRYGALDREHPLRRVREARCATCSKTPDHIEWERSVDDQGYAVTAVCTHGAPKWPGWELTAPSETILMPYEEMGLNATLVFFRRNWAEYRRPTVRELLERAAK